MNMLLYEIKYVYITIKIYNGKSLVRIQQYFRTSNYELHWREPIQTG